MNICIEQAARDYIMKKDRDKAITLTVARRPGSCWGGGREVRLPSVRLGIDAEKKHAYQQVDIAGISVFYADGVFEEFPSLTVKLEKILFFKRLVATAK